MTASRARAARSSQMPRHGQSAHQVELVSDTLTGAAVTWLVPERG